MDLKVKGKWFISLYGPDGEEKQKIVGENVITDDGLSGLVSHLFETATTPASFTYNFIGIGSNSAAAASGDTALGTELARQTGTASQSAGAIYTVTATFPSGVGTGSISEYGLLSSNTAGTLFSRDIESVVNKGANDTLTVTTEITFT